MRKSLYKFHEEQGVKESLCGHTKNMALGWLKKHCLLNAPPGAKARPRSVNGVCIFSARIKISIPVQFLDRRKQALVPVAVVMSLAFFL